MKLQNVGHIGTTGLRCLLPINRVHFVTILRLIEYVCFVVLFNVQRTRSQRGDEVSFDEMIDFTTFGLTF